MFKKRIRSSNLYLWLTLPGAFFIIFSLFESIGQFPVLMLCGIFLILLHVFSQFYDKHVDDYLVIENPERIVRCYPGDQAELYLWFKQRGILPIINAKIVVTYDLVLESNISSSSKSTNNETVELPLTLLSFESKKVTLPVIAKSRGVGKVRSIKIVVPNLLGFGEIDLIYNRFYKQEVIVYPSLTEVKGIQLLEPRNNGDQQAQHSIYEQPLLQYGTRDYVSGDPFNRIHWKATAKKDQLQTKVVEKVNQLSWCFVVNVKVPYHGGVIGKIEYLLEHLAYLCRYATENQIPFEIYINVRGRKGVPYIHLPQGEGHNHLMRALELLARVNPLGLTAPYDQTLAHVNQQYKPPYVIHLGTLEAQHEQVLNLWRRQGHRVYHVETVEGVSELLPVEKKGGEQYGS
ncbi:DUF58 domain-containing protein [Aquisalibacillus elongatus]|uniref:Uncharacterized protein (DUF58 family) n=1 Tax=Aquisalibacillus elongatus TaxID=485577 RepID=A0A3N5B3N7_9BACI|nr:DUF58 domain-containing protein [Aquisalibacillus elongatus]RPF50160.1 uncharacterized protein (DUF58 family) [Aquisalibacillus elongatus]